MVQCVHDAGTSATGTENLQITTASLQGAARLELQQHASQQRTAGIEAEQVGSRGKLAENRRGTSFIGGPAAGRGAKHGCTSRGRNDLTIDAGHWEQSVPLDRRVNVLEGLAPKTTTRTAGVGGQALHQGTRGAWSAGATAPPRQVPIFRRPPGLATGWG